MNILILVGSYRKHGNTDQITGLIREHLLEEAAALHEPLEVETVYLGHQEINPCRGCRVCFNRGEEKCPNKDDLLSIKARMKKADGILVASPVYVDDVSGITKTWIDRLAHVCHRPEFAGKSAYLLVTVGSSPFSHSLRTLKLALSTWGHHIAGQAGFKTGALMKPDEMKTRFDDKASRVAHQFFQAIVHKRASIPSFMSLMMFKIQQLAWQKRVSQTIDYQYWLRQGWLEMRSDFYVQHHANRFKVGLARLSGALIAKFVS